MVKNYIEIINELLGEVNKLFIDNVVVVVVIEKEKNFEVNLFKTINVCFKIKFILYYDIFII